MYIVDLLLLAFILAILFGISAARMRGKLPHRGLRRVAQSQSIRGRPANTTFPKGAAKPDDFRGILAHYDGPVRFVPPIHRLMNILVFALIAHRWPSP